MDDAFGVIISNIGLASPPWHSYAGNNLVWSIAGGPGWSSSGVSQELTNKAGWSNTYEHSSDNTSSLWIGELFIKCAVKPRPSGRGFTAQSVKERVVAVEYTD